MSDEDTPLVIHPEDSLQTATSVAWTIQYPSDGHRLWRPPPYLARQINAQAPQIIARLRIHRHRPER